MKLIIDIPEEYKEQFVKNKCDDLFNSLATNEFGYVLRKSFETATFETQPCEDCVSREAVKEQFEEVVHNNGSATEFLVRLWKLPPVQSTRPKGKWIKVDPLGMGDEAYMCSECKTGDWDVTIGEYKFCPYCGAKMEV